MLYTKHILILASTFLFACNNPKAEQQTNAMIVEEELGVDTLVVEEDTLVEKEELTINIVFEEYDKEAFIINPKGSINVYNELGQFVSSKPLGEEVITVRILEKSTTLYSMSEEDKYCSRAHFLKIRFSDNSIAYVDGTYVFVQDKDNYGIECSATLGENGYHIFVARPFSVGAADEDGLTACDDYGILIFYSVDGGSVHLVEGQRKDAYYGEKNDLQYFFFRSDGGVSETIIEGDYDGYHYEFFVLKIGVTYQEARGSYDLRIYQIDGKLTWSMENEVHEPL